VLNLLIALVLSINNATDQCVWYFINLFVDTTLGIFICFVLLLSVDKIARDKDIKVLKSGLYFEKKINKKGKVIHKLKLKMYFSQLGVWILIAITVNNLNNKLQLLVKTFFTWVHQTSFLSSRVNRKFHPGTFSKKRKIRIDDGYDCFPRYFQCN
jgi:hypothetical protein